MSTENHALTTLERQPEPLFTVGRWNTRSRLPTRVAAYTSLYDRRMDEISVDEVERIVI